ncbi:succinyl-diaminopimelate desuccinylase [Dethiosulfatibacter aminovorans DSM 17477]|uniref:Probable succinyl-diaminopimelate desuccinylase n=1 Tax=Dethiosulfatibacter aminovorans DSM 17477 TaxID=1121476 RepID=A0A1M6EZJ5_9FIRM|nr:M20 family metallopeptidase [Dethiosulfatibacter aminovorans]SHI90835.1 succinyl-diaminopimelate desuccinylase [Dethiosulfatibacter aminovorans DSM 17477]
MNISDFYSKKEVVELTQNLVRIPSHKDVKNREKDVAKYIYRFCKENGLEAELASVEGERKNVYVYVRGSGSGRTLMFNGHTDTVPPYKMIIDPFKAEIKDGFIWGRGSNDMKGAIACMVMSAIAIKRSGIKLPGDIIIAAVAGEEEKSDGTEVLVKSGIKADGAIVGEPSNFEYAIGHRGLEWLEFIFRGKGAHGGVPDEGVNAISKASKFIQKVEEQLYPELKKRYNEYMGPSVMNIGRIEGGTQPSTVADYCSLKVDRRYVLGETVDSVINEYQQIIDEIKNTDDGLDVDIVRMESNLMNEFDHMYHYTDPDEEIVKVVKNALGSHIGKVPNITRKRGWTDAATLSYYGNIPTVITGPGDLSYSHTKDERIPINDLVDYVKIYADIALGFCR